MVVSLGGSKISILSKEVSCDLCGSNSFDFVYEKSDYRSDSLQQFKVVKCCECSLSFINPQPLSSEMGKLYPSKYYTVRDSTKWQKNYLRRLQYLKKYKIESLMDIGCAKGDFVKAAIDAGYHADGYEEIYSPSEDDKVSIFSGSSLDLPPKVGKYDCVTAWGVLEHLQSPGSYFELANNLLKENGRFIFLVTNADSCPSRCLFDEDIPRHMTFFSPSTVRQYADKYGFEVETIYHHNSIYCMSNMNWLHYVINKMTGKSADQYRMPNYMQMKGLPINRIYLLMSKIVGRVVTIMQSFFKKNGIITVVLVKKENL